VVRLRPPVSCSQEEIVAPCLLVCARNVRSWSELITVHRVETIRDLPIAFRSVIMVLAPALFAALVATQALADGKHIAIGPETAGVAAGALVAWRTRSIVGCVVAAAAVTALLRAL